MKQGFKSIMRVLLLLSAFLGAAMAATTTCNHDCVTEIYVKILAAEASPAGYKDADMAVYGHLLYHAYVYGGGAGAFDWVDDVLTGIGEACAAEDFDATKRDGLADCFEAAGQEHVDEYAKLSEAAGDDGEGYDWIVGAIANQLAPGSAFAEAYPGLSAAEYETALEIYYVVGAIYEVFTWIETGALDDGTPLFENQAAKDLCYEAVGAAVDYDGTGDFAIALASKGEGLKDTFEGEKCFGNAYTAEKLEEGGFADEKAEVAAIGDDLTAAAAKVEKLKGEQPGAEADDDDEEASAAALSAVVALLAMML